MTPPRRLPPFTAFRHALRLVRDHSALGIRISLAWTAILVALAVAQIVSGPQPAEAMPEDVSVLEFVSAAISVLAFASIAVNWHRFVLRDEMPVPASGLRLDGPVWRYAANSLVVAAALAGPLLIVMSVTSLLPPAASFLVLPTAAVAAALAMTLSIKLPAVALGRSDFSFRDAFAAANDNLWQLLGLFCLNGALILGGVAVIVIGAALAENIHPLAGTVAGLTLASALNIFLTLVSVSTATSVYGFLVERRDF